MQGDGTPVTGNERWLPAPVEIPPLRVGHVHLWLADLDAHLGDQIDVKGILSSAERERMRRFRRPADGERFARARAFLRRVLGCYLALPPSEIPISTGSKGKPEVEPHPGSPPLRFNIAHSKALAICGISGSCEIGVDLEAIDPISDLNAMIRRCLTLEERESLAGIDQSERLIAFLRFWTRKEAYLKGLGVGLHLELAQVSVLDPAQIKILQPQEGVSTEGIPRWRVRDVAPAKGYVGAVAVHGPIEVLRCFADSGRRSPPSA